MTVVRFVGSGDAFGSGGRLQTCILIEDGDWRCLVDCGATSLVGVKAAGIDPASIDVIAVSHLYGDHFGGLPFWLLDAQLVSRRSTRLVLAGHSDLEERLRAAMEVLFPDAYDNSMAESWFATLECELLAPRRFRNLSDARIEIMRFIDWYNGRRRHSSLDNLAPDRYERDALVNTSAT